MIPKDKFSLINDELIIAIGPNNETVGNFVYLFAALPVGHDLDYALEELKNSTDDNLKKAIHIVLAGIVG